MTVVHQAIYFSNDDHGHWTNLAPYTLVTKYV